ncbi:porin [Halomonas lysinitropha]|uniref:Outer membrane pore protein E n=1 Tax=Halomonas lysinitropha TaxID=2607506 RepID=A0A5K1I1P9_9GAMM|nr:porin [Halomonas lysinitropha]VVZ95346.1 Outer membrane pore protein E precursor [Halomonas lysinitropha]
MKKTLLATAIAGALAASGAQAATVYNEDGTKLDIYGNIQIAYYNTDSAVFDNEGTLTGTDSADQIADNGTTFGFAAEHVISDGLSGYLKLELDDIKADEMATANDANDSGDTAYVGLKGNFGDVRLGSYDQLIDDWIQDPITNNEGFDVSDSTTAHGDGGNQQTDKVTYTSPSFSGMQFAVGTQYKGDSESENLEDSGNASFFGGAKYTAGAFSIAAVYDNLDNVQYIDGNGDVDSVGDQYGVTAQYTVDTLRVSAKVERFDSDISGSDSTNFYGLGARYGYGNGDIYAAYQYIDVGAGTFLSELDEIIQDEQDRDETYNEVILGANYSISDAMYVWSEVAWYDREGDDGDGVGVGVTYLF